VVRVRYNYVQVAREPYPAVPRSFSFDRDGPHWRWVMWSRGRRVAKGSRWWASEGGAMRDLHEFLAGLEILARDAA
jgi:hypothetical protein